MITRPANGSNQKILLGVNALLDLNLINLSSVINVFGGFAALSSGRVLHRRN